MNWKKSCCMIVFWQLHTISLYYTIIYFIHEAYKNRQSHHAFPNVLCLFCPQIRVGVPWLNWKRQKEIATAYNPLAREITKQSFFLTWCSVRQWVESKCKNLWPRPCFFFFPSSLKVVQNSQKHPEYKRILWDKVSPLERTVAGDAASSFSMALPLQTLHGLMGNIYTGKNPSVFDAWPPV